MHDIYASCTLFPTPGSLQSGIVQYLQPTNTLEVLVALQTLINVPLRHIVTTTNHIILTLVEEVIEVVAGLESRLTRSDLLATSGEVVLDVLALVLEGGLADVLLGGDIIWTLDPLHGQTAVNVPDNVAMHEPGTWVVGLEADDGVPRGGGAGGAASATYEHGGIATGGVDEVEGWGQGCSPSGLALAQDGEVVAVHVHGVGCEELVLDDEVVPFVLLVEDDGVGDAGVVAGGKGLQGGVLVVDLEGVVVEEPAEDNSIIWRGDLGDGASWEERSRGRECCGRACRLLEERCDAGEGLVSADSELGTGDVASGRRWER